MKGTVAAQHFQRYPVQPPDSRTDLQAVHALDRPSSGRLMRVVVEVLDAQGQVRYLSTSGTRIPLSNGTTRTVLAGQPPVSYDTSVDGQHVRVQALPIRAPVHGVSGNANGVPMGNGPVIGVLLVAKSLSDVDATLLLLRVLLLISGIATLVGTLIASWIIATRVLRPLSELVATARSIAASTARGTRLGNLSQRVPRPRGRDEMVQVVETFNEMLAQIQERVVACTLCPRLVTYLQHVAAQKVRRFRHETYWARPVPSFGDPQARLLILGLAPAAHGGLP